jgi:hypothetical protein
MKKKGTILQLSTYNIHQACVRVSLQNTRYKLFYTDLQFLIKTDNSLPPPLPLGVEPQGAPVHLPSSPGLMSSAHLKTLQRS